MGRLLARWTLPVLVAVVVAAVVAGGAIPRPTTGTGPHARATGVASASPTLSIVTPTEVRVVAVGDVAREASDGRGTSRLVARADPDALLVLGDAAYPDGSPADYTRAFDPWWGRFLPVTRPVPGNHDYRTPEAAGYFGYFAEQVHGRPYYTWDAGGWRFYALNCEIACGARSRQLSWLRRDLAAHPHRPALAYVHEPRFTCSTGHPATTRLAAAWRVLQRYGGRLFLAGHNHAYERFARQDAAGRADPDGLRQLVVGTGGAESYRLRSPCRHRQAGVAGRDGVLVLTLRPHEYAWRFVAVGGRVLDRGRTRF